MKLSAILFLFGFGLICTTSFSQVKETTEPERKEKARTIQEEPTMAQEMPAETEIQRIEIDPSELPEEVDTEVTNNYYNGEITKAYKLMKNGVHTGYLAEVKNGPKKWTLEFDKEGNALNKIEPNK